MTAAVLANSFLISPAGRVEATGRGGNRTSFAPFHRALVVRSTAGQPAHSPATWAGRAFVQLGALGSFLQALANPKQNQGIAVQTTNQRRGRRTKADPRQLAFLDLLDQEAELITAPPVPEKQPGALEFAQRMRDLLNDAVRASPFSRDQIAEMVSELTGKEVTKAQIDSWTGASRLNRFPAELVPAFCVALGNTVLLQGLAEACGCKLIESNELKLARLGQLWLIIQRAEEEQARMVGDLPLFRGGRHA